MPRLKAFTTRIAALVLCLALVPEQSYAARKADVRKRLSLPVEFGTDGVADRPFSDAAMPVAISNEIPAVDISASVSLRTAATVAQVEIDATQSTLAESGTDWMDQAYASGVIAFDGGVAHPSEGFKKPE